MPTLTLFGSLWTSSGLPPRQLPPLDDHGSRPERTADILRVLMVDDEELILRLAAGMARRIQVEMHTARSAAQALAIARTTSFDVIIADILLGEGTDGIDLARQLAHAQPWVSVVLMSGYSASHFELEGLPEGTQFLTKPFNSESLARCLAVVRERRDAPRR
jgi:YesN/AraC family two-component response regulator